MTKVNKKIIFTILVSLFTFDVFAQQPTQEWVARYPGPSADFYGPFLQADKQGNSYIAGTHAVGPVGNYDTVYLLCVKYNSAGIQQWATQYIYPGEAYIQPTGIALDSSGNAYVIADQGPAYYLPTHGLIAKFNGMNGNPVWVRRYFGDYGWSAFDDIKIDRLNNIYAAGGSDSSHLVIRYNTDGDSVWVRKYHPPSCSEGSGACTIDDSLNIIFTGTRRHYYFSGSYDSLLVVKYSTGGILRWESAYSSGLTNANWGAYITNDQIGNLYVGGGTTPSGFAVFLTLRYDRNGVRQWVSIYDAPGSGDNNLKGIAFDRVNNALFVTGGATTNGVQMATTIKYNSATGDSIWVRKDTGTYSRANNSAICVDSSGYCYTTGGTYNLGLFPFDIMTRKYSDMGNSIWFVTYNGPFNGIDYGIDLALDNFRSVYVLATSESGSGIRDYVLIKYNQILGIKPISSEIPQKFALNQNYPNPFNPNTKIRFFIPKTGFIQLKIYDVLGRIKEIPVNKKMQPSEYELIIDGANYSSGVYFYQLVVDGKIIETRKMVVLK